MPDNNSISNLMISVESNADKAVNGLNRFASSLGGMKRAATGAKDAGMEFAESEERTGESAKKAGENVRSFGDKLKSITASASNVSVKFKDIAEGAMKIGSAALAIPRYFSGKLIRNISESVKGLGAFFSSIKRIATYRLIRTALKEITEGITTGIKNLYNWSKAADTTFFNSMNKIATATQYVGNSFAAMVSPLINALAPAIDFIADKFVDLFNLINQIFARLTGRTSYTAAKKVAAQWDDASKKASGSAKKAADDIKRTILGFDEINKLNDANGRSGSGGSGRSGSGIDASNMFENRTISSWVQEMVDGNDFSALGVMIGEKINNALAGINWDVIKSRASHVTTALTSTINGLISSIDPAIIGQSIAEVINTGALTIHKFWSSIEWAFAGVKLRQAIISFFERIDVETAAKALFDPFKSLAQFAYEAIPKSQTEWNLIGTKIAGFINTAIETIPWSTIGDTVGKLLVGALTTMRILAEHGTLTHIAEGIRDMIEEACRSITPEQVGRWVGSILDDVLNAASVLLSIKIDFGGFKISPATILLMGVAAKSLLKSALASIFGTATLGGAATGIGYMASIGLLISAGVQFYQVVDDIINGNQIKIDDITDIIKKALWGIGLYNVTKGNFTAGALMIGIGFGVSLIPKVVSMVKDAIAGNEVSLEDMCDVVGSAFIGIGIALLGVSPVAGAIVASVGIVLRIIPEIDIGPLKQGWRRLIGQESMDSGLGPAEDYIIPFTLGDESKGHHGIVRGDTWYAADAGGVTGGSAIRGSRIGSRFSMPKAVDLSPSYDDNIIPLSLDSLSGPTLPAPEEVMKQANMIGDILKEVQTESYKTLTKIGSQSAKIAKTVKSHYVGNGSVSDTAINAVKLVDKNVSESIGNVVQTVSSGNQTLSADSANTANQLQNMVSSTVSKIENNSNGMIRFVTAENGELKSNTTQTFGQILATVLSSTSASSKSVDDMTNSMTGSMNRANRNVSGLIYSIGNSLVSESNSISWNVSDSFGWIASTIVNCIVNARNSAGRVSFYDIGANIVNGIYNGINAGWNWLNNTISNLASSLFKTAKWILGIRSPSRVFRDEVGKMIGLGWAEGIMDAMPEATKSIADFSDSLKDQLARSSLTPAMNAVAVNAYNAVPEYGDVMNVLNANVSGNNGGNEVDPAIALLESLLAEMRQFNEKEFTAEVTTSSIVRGMTRTNRRAGTTVVSVGG